MTRRRPHNRGVALVSVLMLIFLAASLGAAIAATTVSSMKSTNAERFRETAYALAQNGLNATLFEIEAATAPAGVPSIDIETYLTEALGADHSGTRVFNHSTPEGSNTVTLSDPVAADKKFVLAAVGKDRSGRIRTLVAQVESAPVQALSYGLFGNRIEFHNHDKVNYGVTLETSIFSNSFVLIDSGLRIDGPTLAVNYIAPDEGIAAHTAGINPAHLTPAGRQGDPDPAAGSDAAVAKVTPPPAAKPFPVFDFNRAATAAGSGRQLSPVQFTNLVKNGLAYAATLSGSQLNLRVPLPVANYDAPNPTGISAGSVPFSVVHHPLDYVRTIRLPIAENANQAIPLGSAEDTYELIFDGNPLSDTVLFVNGPLTIDSPTGSGNALIRIEGSLIVNGAVEIQAPTEVLAWWNVSPPYFLSLAQIDSGQTLYQNIATTLADAQSGNFDVIFSHYPAIAANGSVKVQNVSHVEGVVYSVAEGHFHSPSAYSVGATIADLIHNCQFFSFAYDNLAKQTAGFFAKTTGRVKLTITRLEL